MDGSPPTTVRRPQQRRSRETLARILDAFESALAEHTYEEVTVADVCARAGCSVGTFYGRVESKEGLLAHLQARVYLEIEQATQGVFDAERWVDVSLREMLRAHARAIVELHARRRGVVRAVIIEARRRNDFARHTAVFNRDLLDRVASAWATRADEIAHEDVRRACEHAALMAAGYLREAIVFSELWPSQAETDATQRERRVTEALSHMLISFLTTTSAEPGAKGAES